MPNVTLFVSPPKHSAKSSARSHSLGLDIMLSTSNASDGHAYHALGTLVSLALESPPGEVSPNAFILNVLNQLHFAASIIATFNARKQTAAIPVSLYQLSCSSSVLPSGGNGSRQKKKIWLCPAEKVIKVDDEEMTTEAFYDIITQ